MAGIGKDLVREARKRAALTQAELAQRAGTTQSAIARIETGDVAPSFDSVLRLVRLCGLDLDIMLVPRDESDWAQAQRLAGLSPQERLVRHQGVQAQLRELRQAGARARAAS
jgi:transcriptional regulator with XRE-family HTH domain